MVIQSLLRKLKQTPMDLRTLGRLLPSYATTATYDQIKGKHRSEVFKKHKCVVVLIPSTFSKIGHFVVLRLKARIFFFTWWESVLRAVKTRTDGQRHVHQAVGEKLRVQLKSPAEQKYDDPRLCALLSRPYKTQRPKTSRLSKDVYPLPAPQKCRRHCGHDDDPVGLRTLN